MEKIIWEYYWVKDGVIRTNIICAQNPKRTKFWRELRKAFDEDKVERIGYSKYNLDLEEPNLEF